MMCPSFLAAHAELPLDEKLNFLREARHAFGRTALVLSGGGSFGAFHLASILGFPSPALSGPAFFWPQESVLSPSYSLLRRFDGCDFVVGCCGPQKDLEVGEVGACKD